MLIRNLILTGAFLAGWLPLLLAASQDSVMENVKIYPETRIRVISFPRSTTPVVNPIAWVQFKSRIQEGTRVQKGDSLFELHIEPTLQDLQNRKNKLKETENQSARRLKEIDQNMQTLENRRDELEDSKDIQKARLQYLLSLPLQENVDIAAGRLDVAKKNLEAKASEYKKMTERLEKGLISQPMLEESRYELELQKAQTLYAKRRLDSAQAAPHPKDIEIVTLRIENLDREISKVKYEIGAQQKLNEIEIESLTRQTQEIKEEIAEKEEELTHAVITSPRDGVVLYTPQLKRELAKGGKPSKGMVIAEIPDPESLAFQGELPEQLRYLYSVGDPVSIELNTYPGKPLTGTLLSISPFSRDTDEQENTGVKVLDVVFTCEDPPADLAFGVYGWATLTTANPRIGPAVPASWVNYRGGKPHLSVQGEFEAVNGVVHSDLFQLSPPYPPLHHIQAEGTWKEQEQGELDLDSDRFHVSGELSPLESVVVSTPKIRAWDTKVTFLYPESTFIEAGETLVVLDSERIKTNADSKTKDARKNAEEKNTAEKELELRKRERDFQVGSQETQLAITKLERDLALITVSVSAIHQALLDVRSAELRLEKAERELARIEAHPELSAASERARKKRDVHRLTLKLEEQKIKLFQSQQGISEQERSLAELNVLRKEADTAKTKANHFRQVAGAENRLRWRIRRLRRANEQRDKADQDLESLTIRAPVRGLVKYEKLWDGVRRSKLKTGMRVWRGMNLLSLSNTGKVFVEVAVPERYVNKLHQGMKVQIQIPIEGNRMWTGEITHMGELLETAAQPPTSNSLYTNREPVQEQVLPVRVHVVSQDDTQLKPGAIAHVIFPFSK
jgi:HlyD family secretion protein